MGRREQRSGTGRRTSSEPDRGWTGGSAALDMLREGRLASLDGGALLRHLERRNSAGSRRAAAPLGSPARSERNHHHA